MENQSLEKSNYKNYFDLISKSLHGTENQIELEVMGLDIGDQIEAQSIQLDGISYDQLADTLHINTKPLAHAIQNPSEVIVASEGANVSAICVKDSENHLHILKFNSPLSLTDNDFLETPKN